MKEELKKCGFQEAFPYKASKWLKHQFLLDADEMRLFLDSMESCHIFKIGTVCPYNEIELGKNGFLKIYKRYIDDLKTGRIPEDPEYNRAFSSAITCSLDCLYAIELEGNQAIVRIAKPIVQIQLHTMDYSLADRQFHPMVFGNDTIQWGLQISYPQIYQDPHNSDLIPVLEGEFSNNGLYRHIQKWIRENTIPTPFVIDGSEKVNIPVRIGKKCLSWINEHPQLALKGLQVCA